MHSKYTIQQQEVITLLSSIFMYGNNSYNTNLVYSPKNDPISVSIDFNIRYMNKIASIELDIMPNGSIENGRAEYITGFNESEYESISISTDSLEEPDELLINDKIILNWYSLEPLKSITSG